MNTEELREQWQRVSQRVENLATSDQSQTRAFLARLQPQAMSDGFIMLTVDNAWLRDWITTHYLEDIQKTLEEIHHTPYVVAIEVDEKQNIPDQPSERPAPAPTPDTPSSTFSPDSPEDAARPDISPRPEDNLRPSAGQATQPETGEPSLPPSRSDSPGETPLDEAMMAPTSSLTFENFVIGASNQMAYSMAVAVAEDPGQQMLNPLFIYGKSGLGKTHLMRAIQNYVAETRPDLVTVYTDSADFLNGYIEASVAHDKEKSSYNSFKRRYQDADILLIDDIQYFQGKEQTLNTVFDIFNHMVDQDKQVVLAADRAPKNIVMDERYQSRFNRGGTFDIQPPEVETKLGIIKSFVEEYRTTGGRSSFSLDEDIERYIAENSSSNIRELKSAVTKVIYSMNVFNKDTITEEEVARLLENHFSGGAMKKLTISDIQKQVELYYDIPHTDLIGQKRSRNIAYPRHIAIYLAREMLDLPYNDIGKRFGNRDHSTIMHSVTSVEKKLKDNREMREEIENIKRRIKEM